MPDLREHTVKSALFVVRESMAALRQHVANLDDPASVDRVIREAEIMSTSLKKLHAYLGDEPKNDAPRQGARASSYASFRTSFEPSKTIASARIAVAFNTTDA